jgi:ubiquinone/menaquinone biosynthesis C-methylase UbiE
MLARRYDPEIMDDFSITDERVDRALAELKIINAYLGGAATTRKGLRMVQNAGRNGSPLSILDAGAGGADVFQRDGNVITVLDKNPRSCAYLRQHTKFTVVCADAMRLPFKEKSFDVVHVSLFLHHFTESDIVSLLTAFHRIAKQYIVINDLRRSRAAFLGIRLLTKLFSKSTMVQHDGPLSVLRGFSKDDLTVILRRTGFDNFILKRTWAFHWLVIIPIDHK